MILLILIVAAIMFIYFNIIPGKRHTFIAWLSLIVTILCVVGIVEHDYNHWGMKTKTTSSTNTLVSSATPRLPILLYQPLGNGTEKVYLYKTGQLQKKPKSIKLDKVSTKVKRSSQPKVTIKTTCYTYSNTFNQIMFGVFGHDKELKHREYIFSIPYNWKVMSVNDAKQLQKQMMKKQQFLKQKSAQ